MRLLSFLKAVEAAIDSYLEPVPSAPCQHSWRPAYTSFGPARYCVLCEATEQLTKEMFYAQFGTIPHTWY